MDKSELHALLEGKFLSYRDLVSVPVSDNGEKLVSIPDDLKDPTVDPARNDGSAPSMHELVEMQHAYTGNEIYVRSRVAAMLADANRAVKAIFSDSRLTVVFGYRHPEVQKAGYEHVREMILAQRSELSGDDLREAVHRYTAVPEVAGHPTGGAVDVHIRDHAGVPIDMGTGIGALVEETYTFSPFIGKTAWHHRQILRACMIKACFAPFDGEWWHFSYGDREWAKYYNQPSALYTQLDFRAG